MNTASEFKTLLSKFNKGIQDVTISEGILQVSVGGKTIKAVRTNALGVITDLKRSRGFREVNCVPNPEGGALIFAIPA